MPNDQTIDLPVIGRAGSLQSVDETTRSFEVLWTTGAQVRRYSWARDEEFDEELVVSPGAMRLDRLNSGAPFLNSHASWSLRSILGVVEDGSIRIENGRAFARIRLSERDEVEVGCEFCGLQYRFDAVDVGELFTPPSEAGILQGITRKFVKDELCPMLGYSCTEKYFTMDELLDADEVFLTGSAAEMIAVREVLKHNELTVTSTHQISDGEGPITNALRTKFREIVTSDHVPED